MSKPPAPWLIPQYEAQRAHTVDLVQRSITALQAAGDPVTVWRIVAISRQLDPMHKGISSNGIMGNAEARSCYVAARSPTRRTAQASGNQPKIKSPANSPDGWTALEARLPAEVFHAPRTWGDPSNRGRWPVYDGRN